MTIFNLVATIALDAMGYKQGLKQAEKSASDFSKSASNSFRSFGNVSDETKTIIRNFYDELKQNATRQIEELSKAVADGAISYDEYREKLNKLTDQIKEADESMGSLGEQGEKQQKSLKEVFSKIGQYAKVAASAITAIAGAISTAAGAIVKLSTAALDFTGAIDDAAKQLQITTDQYQEWDWIMKQIGVDSSTLEAAFRQIATVVSNVSEGNVDAIMSLRSLGIEYKTFGQLNAAEQLDTLVAAFQRLENGTEKTRLAQDIFGNRVYQKLMPILNDAEGSVDALKDKVHELGLVMDEETITAGADLGDKLEYMKGTVKQLAYNYGAELFPAVEMVIDGIIGLATGSEDADNALEQLSDGITGIVDKVINDLPVFIDIAANFLIQLINGIVSKIPEMVPALVTLVENILFTVIEALPDVVASAGDIVVALLGGLLRLDWGMLVAELLTSIFTIVFETIPNFLYDTIQTIIDLFTTGKGFEMLGKIGVGIAQALVNGLLKGIESGINFVIQGINSFTKGLSSIWTWAFGEDSAIPPIEPIHIEPVHWLAKGGMFDDLLKQTGGKGTVWAVGGEGGKPEVAYEGRNGSGITPIEDWTGAMIDALLYVFGRGVVLRVGDKDMRAWLVDAQNVALKSQGRKTLNTVTRY